MESRPPLLLGAVIGALTAVFAAGVSVVAYLVAVLKEPLLTSLPAVIIIGGVSYAIAALFGIVVGLVAVIVERYPRITQFLLPVIFAVMAGVCWADWVAGKSPHISHFFAEVIAACSWALTAAVAVLVRTGWQRWSHR